MYELKLVPFKAKAFRKLKVKIFEEGFGV